MELIGRRCLVTGGGRGIGRAIALALAREGAHVAILARTGSELDEDSRAFGRSRPNSVETTGRCGAARGSRCSY